MDGMGLEGNATEMEKTNGRKAEEADGGKKGLMWKKSKRDWVMGT